MAGNAEFQLEVSENEDVTFPASEFPDSLSPIHGPLVKCWVRWSQPGRRIPEGQGSRVRPSRRGPALE